MSRWGWRAGGSLAIAAVLLAIVPIDVVWDAIGRVSLVTWLVALGVFIAGHAINAVKFQVLVGPAVVTTAACLRAHYSGMAANLGLPGVAGGEIVRVAYLAPAAGTARVAIGAVADRLVDGVVLAAIVVLASRAAGVPSALVATPASRLVMWGAVSVGVVVAVLLWRRHQRRDGASRSAAIGDAVRSLWRRPHLLLVAALLSVTVQSAFVLTNAWVGAQVGVDIGLAPWFLAWTASKLSALLPISLGGIGVREATLVSVLTAYGASADLVLATGILWEGAIIVGTLTGFLATQLATPRDGTRRF